MVKFVKVTKKFGGEVALESVSFEVSAGELAFITGPSGAGKTTIIRLLLRELKLDKGKILIQGKDIGVLRSADIPYFRRKIGVVFQDFKLLADLNVWENVALALEVSGENKGVSGKIDEVLKRVGIANKATLFPRQLAGGELQRTVLARALVTGPKLILADEPTGNLDPVTSRQIVELFDEAAKEGTTVIMATHNAEIVNSLSRHVIHLVNGKVIADKQKGKYQEDKE